MTGTLRDKMTKMTSRNAAADNISIPTQQGPIKRKSTKRKKCQTTTTTSNNKRSSLIINTTTTTPTSNNHLNILIVDDNPINISILKKSLYKIISSTTTTTTKRSKTLSINLIKEASHGIEALELLNRYNFDIIFLDIDMPILNGIDTTKYIRRKGQTIPIIAVTTNDSTESRDNYIKIGMNDCLSKPVDIHLLEQTLHNVILLLPTQEKDLFSPNSPPPLSTSCSILPPSPEEE